MLLVITMLIKIEHFWKKVERSKKVSYGIEIPYGKSYANFIMRS